MASTSIEMKFDSASLRELKRLTRALERLAAAIEASGPGEADAEVAEGARIISDAETILRSLPQG